MVSTGGVLALIATRNQLIAPLTSVIVIHVNNEWARAVEFTLVRNEPRDGALFALTALVKARNVIVATPALFLIAAFTELELLTAFGADLFAVHLSKMVALFADLALAIVACGAMLDSRYLLAILALTRLCVIVVSFSAL